MLTEQKMLSLQNNVKKAFVSNSKLYQSLSLNHRLFQMRVMGPQESIPTVTGGHTLLLQALTQFRVSSQLIVHVFALWEETGVLRQRGKVHTEGLELELNPRTFLPRGSADYADEFLNEDNKYSLTK